MYACVHARILCVIYLCAMYVYVACMYALYVGCVCIYLENMWKIRSPKNRKFSNEYNFHNICDHGKTNRMNLILLIHGFETAPWEAYGTRRFKRYR